MDHIVLLYFEETIKFHQKKDKIFWMILRCNEDDDEGSRRWCLNINININININKNN